MRTFRVHYFEEPRFEECASPRLEQVPSPQGVNVLSPVLPAGGDSIARDRHMRTLLDAYLAASCPDLAVGWYYTPMALRYSAHISFPVTVYDCMDELSGFKGAPPELGLLERKLMRKADVVFTGGLSLYEAKRRLHANAHAFPSSVDVAHFLPARSRQLPEPADLLDIPHPRIGYFGVIDERLDADLLDGIARTRPDWQFVMIGPVVKIDPAGLPRRHNIHWLGGKDYADLPAYLAALDVGFMPFALNEATRFISPTKTPEFLAAGLPVVSTPIVDVVRTWGSWGLVEIAADAMQGVRAIAAALDEGRPAGWLAEVDRRLASTSWDRTWEAMCREVERIRDRADHDRLRSAGSERGHV